MASSFGPSAAVEFAIDFMFWPTPDRKFGWFLETAYSYSLVVAVGLLIPIP
jgi:hypothetical protein